jgi:hypothetical protein
MKPVTDPALLAELTTKPVAPKAAATAGLGNDRQQGGAKRTASSLVNYTATLTGLSPEQVKLMTPEQVEQAVLQRGKRVFQGKVMGNIPFISNIANADLQPYVMGAAAGQSLQDNPTGTIQLADVTTIGKLQQPSPELPLEAQARLIRQNLEQAYGNMPDRTAKPGWSIKKVK